MKYKRINKLFDERTKLKGLDRYHKSEALKPFFDKDQLLFIINHKITNPTYRSLDYYLVGIIRELSSSDTQIDTNHLTQNPHEIRSDLVITFSLDQVVAAYQLPSL